MSTFKKTINKGKHRTVKPKINNSILNSKKEILEKTRNQSFMQLRNKYLKKRKRRSKKEFPIQRKVFKNFSKNNFQINL